MTTTSRNAALMALYTFLLALGAAAPIAASYAPGVAARGDAAELHPGGYRAPVEVESACEAEVADEPEAAGTRRPASAGSGEGAPPAAASPRASAHAPWGAARGAA